MEKYLIVLCWIFEVSTITIPKSLKFYLQGRLHSIFLNKMIWVVTTNQTIFWDEPFITENFDKIPFLVFWGVYYDLISMHWRNNQFQKLTLMLKPYEFARGFSFMLSFITEFMYHYCDFLFSEFWRFLFEDG